jgi:apolipoprotein N-acyltransferase
MAKPTPAAFRRAGDQPVQATPPFAETARGRLILCIASVILLSLSFAPLKQFYCAWFGLTPWLVVIARAQRRRTVLFWSWITGIAYFSINIWWIAYVTIPGAIALMIYMGIWFAIAGWLIWATQLFAIPDDSTPVRPSRGVITVLLVAAVWVTMEFAWGNFLTGLPWLFLAHTQTPILAMCQIADFAGTYGVTFWVVLVNAWLTMLILHRLNPTRLILSGVVVAAVLLLTLTYGLFRMGQKTTSPGPTVMVVQPNFPQSNTGSKGATLDEIMDFHVSATRAALAAGPHPDLVAWSETMMPELNAPYREYMHEFVTREGRRNVGQLLDNIYAQLTQLAAAAHINLLVGGITMLPDRPVDGKPTWNRRNSAFLFDPEGHESAQRYDKIHLVPFGEFTPFRESFPPLYRFFSYFNPYGGADYTVHPGTELTVFQLEPGGHRFVSAICFEDVDARLMTRMFDDGKGGKRADFIVNLTNDGWFATPQMQQHLQLSTFRCIENRVPTARSVNTGVSGFIDSVGRVHDTIPVHTTGARTVRLELDHRVTAYTHFGDVFAGLCMAATVGLLAFGVRNRMKNRKATGR